MQDAIAIIMAILGTVLVLSGAAALWAAALTNRPADAATGDLPEGALGPAPTAHGPAPTRVPRSVQAMSRLPTPDRLIIWGIVLLALSAVAVGAVTFGATATAGTR